MKREPGPLPRASAIDVPRKMLRFAQVLMRCGVIAALSFLAVVVTPAGAQSAVGSDYSQDELDQLVAPIALYPDQLLTQILIAATYPLEVVEAERFVQQNPGLEGDALDQALADKNWDPSVQSLGAYPQVLAMMNDNLEWTQRLGDAFLVDQSRVMDTVQSLRQKALTAGNLQSTPQLSVTTQDDDIVIDTTQPDAVYVPVYNPQIIYGPWWAPAYPPWFWCPPDDYGYPFCPVYTVGIVFGAPWPIWYNHWGWAHPRWHGHSIAIDDHNNRFWNNPGHPRLSADGNWQHSPPHRRGVAYPNAPTRDRFSRIDPDAVRSRQEFRGYERIPQAPNAARPALSTNGSSSTVTRTPLPRPIAPTPFDPGFSRQQSQINAQRAVPSRQFAPTPFDPGFSRQQTQINAQRGMQSRQSMPFTSMPAPMSRGPVGGAPAPVGRAPAPGPSPSPQGGGRGR
jgi:hypothetical protein